MKKKIKCFILIMLCISFCFLFACKKDSEEKIKDAPKQEKIINSVELPLVELD